METRIAAALNLKKALENENYLIKSQVLLQNLAIPADAALLVVAGPRNDYLPPETDAIQKYLAGGGRALFMLDPAVELPNLTQMLAAWNIKVRNDLVIDENPSPDLHKPEMPCSQVWAARLAAPANRDTLSPHPISVAERERTPIRLRNDRRQHGDVE
jgi:hypothetical protein